MKVLKKKVEKRKKKFEEMGMSRSEALQRKLHEEGLLGQRIMVFLLANSILFVGFATLFSSEAGVLLYTIPCIGVIASLFLFPHSFCVKIELDALAMFLREPTRSIFNELFRGVSVAIWLGVLFCIIWGASLFEVIC